MKSRFLLFFIPMVTASCTGELKNQIEEEKNENLSEHWTYQGETGPEHWAEIEKKSDCNGKHQSPINILDLDVIAEDALSSIELSYAKDTKIHDVTNNGHSIQYNFEKGDYILFEGKKFELHQIHFHEPAEHTINGIRYPLETHLVHISEDNEIVVLGVFAQEGISSKPFTFLEEYLPLAMGKTKLVNQQFDLNETLPVDKSYYRYSGSLTTPPCTENVTWFVFKNPITISVEQVKQLQELMPLNNYRTEQPVNAREIHAYING